MWVGPYRLLEQIGAGALGIVHRAVSPQGEELAVKVIARSTPERDARLQRELETQAALGAKLGFVPLLDAGMDERYVFLVMPFYPGGTLADRLRKGPLPQGEAEDLARGLAAALAEAHAQGLIHRDLKPANILFDAQGRCFIADLGLAKAFGKAGRLSTTGEMRGSIGYMAPEQARSAKHAGPPADVFSWGAVVFEAVSGRRAFDATQPLEILRQVEEGGAPPLLRLCPQLSPRLAQVVDQSLSSAPADRPLDGATLLEMLEAEAPPPARKKASLGVATLVAAAVAGALAQQLIRARADAPGSPTPSATTQARVQPTQSPAPTNTPSQPVRSPAATPEPDRLQELLGGWPRQAPFQPRAVWGDTRGRLAIPLGAVGWVSEDEVLAIAGREVWRWSAANGALCSRRELEVQVSPRAAKSLDAPRGRLWLVYRNRLEHWDLNEGKRLASFQGRAYGRVAHAPEGDACAVASRKEVAFYRGSERKPVWRTALPKKSRTPQLAVLPGGQVVAGGESLLVFDPKGALTRTIELPAPVDQGPFGLAGTTLYLVDKAGTLQVWDLASWKRVSAKEKALPSQRNGVVRLLAVGPDPFLGVTQRGRSQLQRLGEKTTREFSALSQVAARGRRLLLGQGSRVSLSGPEGPLWKIGPAVDGWLAPCAEGAYSFGAGQIVRWSADGQARTLAGPHRRGPLLATAEGYYVVDASKHLERWREGAQEPEQRWESRQTGPLGAGELSLLTVLPDGAALGYSRRTLGERKGNSYVVRGQKQDLLVYGPGEGTRDLDWLGSEPIAGGPLRDDRVGLVCEDRVVVRSLTSDLAKEQRFASATPWVGLRSAGQGFLRLSREGLEVWAWGAAAPDRVLPLPKGVEGRAIPTRKGKTAGPRRLVATESWAAATFQRQVFWWNLESGVSQVLPLEGVVTLSVVGAELWAGTARGELVVLAPR